MYQDAQAESPPNMEGAPKLCKPWARNHCEIVLAGLRERKPLEAIAENLRNDLNGRPNANERNVYNMLYNHGSIESFLRKQGMIDEVEIEEIVQYYPLKKSSNGARVRHKNLEGVDPWKPKPKYVPPPRPMKDDVLKERSTLEGLVKRGIEKGKSLAAIETEATSPPYQIPTTIGAIEKIIRAYRTVEGFLEHAGLSGLEARTVAERYEGLHAFR